MFVISVIIKDLLEFNTHDNEHADACFVFHIRVPVEGSFMGIGKRMVTFAGWSLRSISLTRMVLERTVSEVRAFWGCATENSQTRSTSHCI